MKSALLLLTVVAVAYGLLCLGLYLTQRSLIYFPTPERADVAADEVRVESVDAQLRIWRLHGDRANAILYFGGNAEDVALNLPEFAAWFPDCAVYLVNYRGYGGSSGSPSEAALYRDAEAVYDVLQPEHALLTVVGRSLGSAVATHLAAVRDLHKLVLITPFDSFVSLADAHYPFVPVSLLLRDRYDSQSRAHRIRVPVLVLVAENDEIVPSNSSKKLAAAIAPELLTFAVVENTSHNSIGTSPAYGQALRAFACEGDSGGPRRR